MCHTLDFVIDKDYPICYGCYNYYDEHNPDVIDILEAAIECKDIKKSAIICSNCSSSNVNLINNQYICSICDSSNGYIFVDEKREPSYYRKMYYNRKYQLEKYIKKYESYKGFDRMKVITLFNDIVNKLIELKPERKRTYKFNLILSKVFEILNYDIKIKDNKSFNKAFNEIHI